MTIQINRTSQKIAVHRPTRTMAVIQTGPAGANGRGMNFKGKDTYANITAIASPDVSDTWVQTDAGGGGVAGDALWYSGMGWVNIGSIVGPQGDPGADGADSVVPGPAGNDSTVPGPPGDDAVEYDVNVQTGITTSYQIPNTHSAHDISGSGSLALTFQDPGTYDGRSFTMILRGFSSVSWPASVVNQPDLDYEDPTWYHVETMKAGEYVVGIKTKGF